MTELRLSADGSTITVFIPVAWRRRSGRKVIVAPPGYDDWAPPPKIDRALLKALARAQRWRRLLEEGRFGTLAELADAGWISRSYVCRVLRLTLLAPDVVEWILDGRSTAGLAQFLKPFPIEWEKQREQFNLAASQPEVRVRELSRNFVPAMLALTDGDNNVPFTLTSFLRPISVAALPLDPGARGRVLLLVGVILGHTGASDSDLYVG